MIDSQAEHPFACEAAKDPLRPRWSLVVTANNDRVLRNTLLASPAITPECQVIVERGFSCAGKAYNAGLDKALNDVVVFAHQDVYLPADWLTCLSTAIKQVEFADPNWGVLGPFGVTRSKPAELRGHCYSTGLKGILGASFTSPIAARSLDEFVLVVRRSSGLRFDEQLPGFHLYGTDICLLAESRQLGCYIIPAFCLHNANGVTHFPREFWRAWFYLRRKWWQYLPVTTCCTTITKWCTSVARRLAQELKQFFAPPMAGTRCEDTDSLRALVSRINPPVASLKLR